MINKIKIVGLFGLLLIGFQNCEKEADNPQFQKYDMQYLVILNEDPKVTRIVLDTWTTFPEENITEWIGTAKKKHESSWGEDDYLYDYDSVYIQTERQVYSGCTRYMKVRFWFNEYADTITYRDYIFQSDTIEKKLDSKLTMIWPDDSAKYEYYEHSY
jgi:hypothetical protein